MRRRKKKTTGAGAKTVGAGNTDAPADPNAAPVIPVFEVRALKQTCRRSAGSISSMCPGTVSVLVFFRRFDRPYSPSSSSHDATLAFDDQTAVGDKTGAQILRLREARHPAAQIRCQGARMRPDMQTERIAEDFARFKSGCRLWAVSLFDFRLCRHRRCEVFHTVCSRTV